MVRLNPIDQKDKNLLRVLRTSRPKQSKDIKDFLDTTCTIEGCKHTVETSKCIYCGKFFCIPHRDERNHNCPESFFLAIIRRANQINEGIISIGIYREALKVTEKEKEDMVFKEFY